MTNSIFKNTCTKQRNTLGSTHAFPLNNPALCKQWVKNVGREDFIPSKTSRLCSAHFEESCFQVDIAKKLKPDAVPTRPFTISLYIYKYITLHVACV
uniref:THAP domain-containing protein 1 n=1 Tax=Gouania willdenowi TaxID=441366 RepID=A0A8C5D2I7_GOUWI